MGAEHVAIDGSIKEGVTRQLTPAAIGARACVIDGLVGLSTF